MDNSRTTVKQHAGYHSTSSIRLSIPTHYLLFTTRSLKSACVPTPTRNGDACSNDLPSISPFLNTQIPPKLTADTDNGALAVAEHSSSAGCSRPPLPCALCVLHSYSAIPPRQSCTSLSSESGKRCLQALEHICTRPLQGPRPQVHYAKTE